MVLGLILVCTLTPWILAEENGNLTTETTTYVDSTRREEVPHNALEMPLSEDPIENVTQTQVVTDNGNTEKNVNETDVRSLNQNSLPTETEFEGERLCDNAEFLVNILTAVIPLLKKEVPEHARTSYVLKVFKDLLKSSPETAKDEEVMFKINDLLQTLEKYHVNNLVENKNALRHSVPELKGVNSKIVFKYEVPHFQNENCTAELLAIIKVVRESISRLVNNPLCKSKILPTKLPLVTTFDDYFDDSGQYSYLSSPKDDTIITQEKKIPLVSMNTYYNNFPFQDTHASHSYSPEKPLDTFSVIQFPYNSHTDSPNIYDSSPTFPHMINGETVKLNYPLDINETDDKNLSKLYLTLDGSSPLNQKHDIEQLQFSDVQFPTKQWQVNNEINKNLLQNIKHPLPLNIYGFDDSSLFNGENNREYPTKYYSPEEKPFEMTEPDDDKLVNFGQEPPIDNLQLKDYIPIETGRPIQNKVPPIVTEDLSFQGMSEPPSKYIPLEFDNPDYLAYIPIGQNSQEQNIYKSYTPLSLEVNGLSESGNMESVYPFQVTGDSSSVFHDINPYKSPFQISSPFAVNGDGSGIVQIGQSQPYSDFQFNLPSENPIHYSKILNESFEINNDSFGEDRIDESQPNDVFPFDLITVSTSPSPFEVIGEKGSAEIPFGQSQPNPSFDFDISIKKETVSPFHITGSAESAYVPIGQPLNPLDFHINDPENKQPTDVFNKYDSSAKSTPLLNSGLDSSPENLSNNREPSPFTSYEPYLPIDFLIPTPKPLSSLEIIGDGSEEIQIESLQQPKYDNFMSFHTPVQQKDKPIFLNDYFIHHNPQTNGNVDTSQERPLYDEKGYVPYLPSSTPDFDPTKTLPIAQDINIYSNGPEIKYLYPKSSENDHPDTNKYYLTSEDGVQTNGLPDSNKKIIVSEPVTQDFLQTVNNYIDPGTHYLPYENVLQSETLPNDFNISKSISLTPNKMILTIIKDDVDIMEQKIPKKYLSVPIRNHITKIKELLNLDQLTVEEYVRVIRQYQILIDLIKNSNISNKILNELLSSLTTGGKLPSQTGKPNVIELTYLVKRPTPLIYQPYYYIKYQLPYESFLARLKRILARKPHLIKDPAKLYKELIHISKVAETSPDLEGYGKDDIQEITFNDGTLAGAKMVEGKVLDMYNKLNALTAINADYTIDDVYQIIKNLDAQLKHTPEHGLAIEYDNGPATNYIKNTDKTLIKLEKPLKVTEKISKISTNNIVSDQVNVLDEIKNIRSNTSSNKIIEKNNESLNANSVKVNNSIPAVTRSKDTYNEYRSSDLVDRFSTKPSGGHFLDGKIKTDKVYHNNALKNFGNKEVAYDYLPMYSELSKKTFSNFSGKNSTSDEPYGVLKKNDVSIDWKKLYSKSIKHQKIHSSSIGSKLLDATINAYKKDLNSHKLNKNEFQVEPERDFEPSITSTDYFEDSSNIINNKLKPSAKYDVYSSIGSKLLDATIKAHNFKQPNDPTSQQLYLDSEPSASSNYIISKPKIGQSQLLQQSNAYVNGIPLKYAKTYVNNPNQVNRIQMHNNDGFLKQSQYYQTNPYYNLVKDSRKNIFPNQRVYKNSLLNPYYSIVSHRMPIGYKQIRKPWSRDIVG